MRAADDLAQLTALAGLSARLSYVVSGWRAAGVPDVEVMEAELVAECWAVIARLSRLGEELPGRASLAVVDEARERVRVPRRRQRRAETRQVPLAAGPVCLAGRVPPGGELAGLLVDVVRAGRLDAGSAALVYVTRAAGWSVTDAAGWLGTTPATVRATRSRIERHLIVVPAA